MNAAYVRHALYVARGYSTEHITAIERDRAARLLACPYCKAKPWELCSFCGIPRQNVHPSRRELVHG